MKLAPYDELNVIRERIQSVADSPAMTVPEKRKEVGDLIIDLLMMSYMYGVDDLNEQLGTDILPDGELMTDIIFADLDDGRNVIDRTNGHIDDDGTFHFADIMRMIESEMTRDYNSGALNAADMSGVKYRKTWVTMMDEKVRDSHQYLEGMTVEGNGHFVTLDGDSALGPGGFSRPENNVNCRCGLRFETVI